MLKEKIFSCYFKVKINFKYSFVLKLSKKLMYKVLFETWLNIDAWRERGVA